MELAKASEDADEYTRAVEKLRKGMIAAFATVSAQRRELAEVGRWWSSTSGARSRSPGKVVCFMHHHSVAHKLPSRVCRRVRRHNRETPMPDRQAAVERFQKDPGCKLIIGSFGAMGVGHTLTASPVVMAELDWVPGNVSQAEDRCHRIGQKNSVLVQHLVVEGSLDATMAKRIVSKQKIIDRSAPRHHPGQDRRGAC